MKQLIGYCGLDCESCEARKATINNDKELRIKVAKEWSDLNGVEITPEMINCEGCRVNGVKTPFCDRLCPIRQCALNKKVNTCGNCKEIDKCGKIQMITSNNKEACKNNCNYDSDNYYNLLGFLSCRMNFAERNDITD